MAESKRETILMPHHFRISASADRRLMALTFRGNDEKVNTVVLPTAGAAALHLKLEKCLQLLRVQAMPNAEAAAAAPAPS